MCVDPKQLHTLDELKVKLTLVNEALCEELEEAQAQRVRFKMNASHVSSIAHLDMGCFPAAILPTSTPRHPRESRDPTSCGSPHPWSEFVGELSQQKTEMLSRGVKRR